MTLYTKGIAFLREHIAMIGAIAVALYFAGALNAHADTFTRQLEQGMSGADVTMLQTFLASDPSIYPRGLVTGYFGPLTFAAVSNYQRRNGISAVGRVGPITLRALNGSGGIGGSSDRSAPLISTITVTTSSSSADITWSTNEPASSAFYYNLAPIALTEGLSGPGSVAVSGTPVGSSYAGLRTSHNVNLPVLQPNTTYYFVIHAADQPGNVNVTWPTTLRTQ